MKRANKRTVGDTKKHIVQEEIKPVPDENRIEEFPSAEEVRELKLDEEAKMFSEMSVEAKDSYVNSIELSDCEALLYRVKNLGIEDEFVNKRLEMIKLAADGNSAAMFVVSNPRRRIRILQELREEDRTLMLKAAADLGYGPAAELFKKVV